MWLKDLEEFETAWENYLNGKLIKTKDTKISYNNKGGSRRRKIIDPKEPSLEELEDNSKKNSKNKKGKNNEKNLMQQTLENEKEFLKFYEGRKKVKGDDWYKYETVQPEKP